MNRTQAQRTPTGADLMEKAFAPGRDPRSQEYKQGVLSILRLRIDGVRRALPYEIGTAQADAYFAGQDEGHRIWRALRVDPKKPL